MAKYVIRYIFELIDFLVNGFFQLLLSFFASFAEFIDNLWVIHFNRINLIDTRKIQIIFSILCSHLDVKFNQANCDLVSFWVFLWLQRYKNSTFIYFQVVAQTKSQLHTCSVRRILLRRHDQPTHKAQQEKIKNIPLQQVFQLAL